jgi:hypothetical protein
MSKRLMLERIKKLITDWAAQYPHVELAYVEVYFSGIADNIHVIVVASKGFENWDSTDRENDLYWFLRKQLGDAYIVKIYLLRTMTEEEYDRYEIVRE